MGSSSGGRTCKSDQEAASTSQQAAAHHALHVEQPAVEALRLPLLQLAPLERQQGAVLAALHGELCTKFQVARNGGSEMGCLSTSSNAAPMAAHLGRQQPCSDKRGTAPLHGQQHWLPGF